MFPMFHKENPDNNRNQVVFYTLDELVQQEHFLSQIGQVIDFPSSMTESYPITTNILTKFW